jgi:hypothetical protein
MKAIFSFLSFLGLCLATSLLAAAPRSDAEGSSDHPLLSRFVGVNERKHAREQEGVCVMARVAGDALLAAGLVITGIRHNTTA